MTKAILVIDMPETCGQCSLCAIGSLYLKCSAVYGSQVDMESKPNWCPLIPEPPQATPDNSDMSIEWNMGWNACLDCLEGKT